MAAAVFIETSDAIKPVTAFKIENQYHLMRLCEWIKSQRSGLNPT